MTENVLLCIIICFTVICVVSIAAGTMKDEDNKDNKQMSIDAMFYKLHDIALKRGATSEELKLFHKIYWRYIADYKEGDDEC